MTRTTLIMILILAAIIFVIVLWRFSIWDDVRKQAQYKEDLEHDVLREELNDKITTEGPFRKS